MGLKDVIKETYREAKKSMLEEASEKINASSMNEKTKKSTLEKAAAQIEAALTKEEKELLAEEWVQLIERYEKVPPMSDADMEHLMTVTCYGTTAYCCATPDGGGKECPRRDNVLRVMQVTPEQYTAFKMGDVHGMFLKLAKAQRQARKNESVS